VGLESTVLDCTGPVPVVLRAGAITLEQLREVIPATQWLSPTITAPAKSPGLKYRHYSPQARVILITQPPEAAPAADAAYIGLSAPPHASAFKRHRICQSLEDYARSLFHFFRQCDEAGVKVIYCQAVAETGLGLALMDRLKRASHA